MSIQPGVYRLKNAKSGTYFDASLQNRGRIHGWESHANQDNQKWQVESAGNNSYYLKNVQLGTYAAICGQPGNGMRVEANDGERTQWSIKDEGNGGYAIHAVDQNGNATAFVIDLDMGRGDNGTAINIWGRSYNGDHSQQLWCFEQVGGGGGYQQQHDFSQTGFQQQGSYGSGGQLREGSYHIINASTGTVVDLEGGKEDEGTPVLAWHRGTGENQIWWLERGEQPGTYRLRNHKANTYIGFALQINIAEGVLLTGHHKAQRPPVEWIIQQSDMGYQFVLASQTNLVLDLAGGGSEDGAKLCLWTNKTGANQQWKLEPTNY